jgi:hypothetical protein
VISNISQEEVQVKRFQGREASDDAPTMPHDSDSFGKSIARH